MSLVETASRRGETPPWHAVYRVAIGMGLLPLVAWSHGGGSDWRVVPLFLLVLLMLRLVPAILRHLLPFSDDAQAHWARHRLLAKRFDSYQWRKLLWFGLGLAVASARAGQARPASTVLAVACLLAGGLGAVRWRGRSRSAQMVGARRSA